MEQRPARAGAAAGGGVRAEGRREEGLPGGLASEMERGLGADLSGVRIHTGDGVADEYGAHAVTIGSNIHFADGQYEPGSPRGKQLLAHELAHTVQQGSAPSRHAPAERGDTDAMERESDAAAGDVLSGRPARIALSAGGAPPRAASPRPQAGPEDAPDAPAAPSVPGGEAMSSPSEPMDAPRAGVAHQEEDDGAAEAAPGREAHAAGAAEADAHAATPPEGETGAAQPRADLDLDASHAPSAGKLAEGGSHDTDPGPREVAGAGGATGTPGVPSAGAAVAHAADTGGAAGAPGAPVHGSDRHAAEAEPASPGAPSSAASAASPAMTGDPQAPSLAASVRPWAAYRPTRRPPP